MSTRGWRQLVGASTTALALSVAGCAGGTTNGGGDDSRSPLAEFFGWDDHLPGDDAFTARDRQLHYQVQDLVAGCMRAQGFDYVPDPFHSDVVPDGHRQWEEVWALQHDDPEQFARQYGYGVTTLDIDDYIDEPDPSDHPGNAYRESLSPGAQEEYDRALFGRSLDELAADGVAEEPAGTEPDGCWDRAHLEVYGDHDEAVAAERAQFETYFEETAALQSRIQSHPRLVAAWAEWTGCLAAVGYPGVASRSDITDLIDQRVIEVYPAEYYLGTYQQEPAEVAALQQFERDLAWADYTCQREHRVDQVEREVRFELEEKFIEDHRQLLEEYRNHLIEQGVLG